MEFTKTSGNGPERLSVEMLDPIMGPGATVAARAPITVSPAGLSCKAELFLGPDDKTKKATSGLITFTSTAAPQSTRLPITMPTEGGVAYHVYIDVTTNSWRILAYTGTEDVIIPGGYIGPITWE